MVTVRLMSSRAAPTPRGWSDNHPAGSWMVRLSNHRHLCPYKWTWKGKSSRSWRGWLYHQAIRFRRTPCTYPHLTQTQYPDEYLFRSALPPLQMWWANTRFWKTYPDYQWKYRSFDSNLFSNYIFSHKMTLLKEIQRTGVREAWILECYFWF